MPNKIDLKKYDGGYWGYLNADVRYTLADLADVISVEGDVPNILHVTNPGGLTVEGTVATTAGLTAAGGPIYLESALVHMALLKQAADDTAAATAGVPVKGLYHTATGEVRIRLS